MLALPVFLLALGLALAGCGGSVAASSQPVETSRVEMPPSYRFDPEVIRVPAGTTVTWHNSDNFTHSVEPQDGTNRNLVVPPGQSVQITFDQPGEYSYICAFHPQNMKGKVIVVAR
jgi:plastocyanin